MYKTVDEGTDDPEEGPDQVSEDNSVTERGEYPWGSLRHRGEWQDSVPGWEILGQIDFPQGISSQTAKRHDVDSVGTVPTE